MPRKTPLRHVRAWELKTGSQKQLTTKEWIKKFSKKHPNLNFSMYDAYAGKTLDHVLKKITSRFKFVTPNKYFFKIPVDKKRKLSYVRAWYLVYGESDNGDLLGYSFVAVDYRRTNKPRNYIQWSKYLKSASARKGIKGPEGVLASIMTSYDRNWFVRDIFGWGSADEIPTNYNPISFTRRNKANKKREANEKAKYRNGFRNVKKRNSPNLSVLGRKSKIHTSNLDKRKKKRR